MSVPLIGLGWGLTIEQLSPFIVEPQISGGVQYAQRDLGGDGTIHQQGAHCIALWPVVDGIEDLDELLAQMGIDDDAVERAAVTAFLPTKRGKWHLYNGYANMPETLTYDLWPSNLRVVFNELTQTA